MMTMSEGVRAATRALREAESTGVGCAPIRDLLDDGDVEAAYQVQRLVTAEKLASGSRLVGRKIGLTARSVQKQLGVDSPDFGALFADTAYATGDEIAPGRFIAPKVEGEVALVLGQDIETDRPTLVDIIRATDFVVPALEIVDSRIRDWDIRLVDTVADNASAGGLVLDGAPVRLTGLDLAEIAMEMDIDGEARSSGRGSDCLGHPLNAALWLARTLAERGDPLRAGDVILTGALGPMVAVEPGSDVALRISGLGSVRVRFGAAA